MNQRIRELAEQAGFYYTDRTGFITPAGCDPAKFAQLIVRECIEQIESQRSSGENSDQWTITRDLCYHNMMAELKQHFGVE